MGTPHRRGAAPGFCPVLHEPLRMKRVKMDLPSKQRPILVEERVHGVCPKTPMWESSLEFLQLEHIPIADILDEDVEGCGEFGLLRSIEFQASPKADVTCSSQPPCPKLRLTRPLRDTPTDLSAFPSLLWNIRVPSPTGSRIHALCILAACDALRPSPVPHWQTLLLSPSILTPKSKRQRARVPHGMMNYHRRVSSGRSWRNRQAARRILPTKTRNVNVVAIWVQPCGSPQ